MVAMTSNPHLNVNFGVMLFGLCVTILSIYILCFLSENVTNTLEAIGDIFYNSAWYRLPPKQQELFIVPIQRAQINFRLSGIGIVECSLKVFLLVRRFRFCSSCFVAL